MLDFSFFMPIFAVSKTTKKNTCKKQYSPSKQKSDDTDSGKARRSRRGL